MNALASNWLIHLAQALWQATLAGAVILLIVRLGRGWSPRLRHALVSLALLKFVFPPMLAMPTGVFSILECGGSAAAFKAAAELPHSKMAMLIHFAGMASPSGSSWWSPSRWSSGSSCRCGDAVVSFRAKSRNPLPSAR